MLGKIEKVYSPALADTVAQQLLRKIEGGAVPPGGKLPTESVLALQFGVSRTVVREAISRLKNEGVVEPRQGSGVYVSAHGTIRPLRIDYAEAMQTGSVLQLLALRRAIEAEAAAVAARRRTEADMVHIEAALQSIDEAVKRGLDGVAEDVAFHQAVVAVAANPYFEKTLTFLRQYLEAGIVITRRNEATSETFSQQVREEHRAIAEAVRAGDPTAARNAIQTHLYNAGRRLAESV